MLNDLIIEFSRLDLLEWFVVGAIGLCGFVWLLLPFIVCSRMFDGHFQGGIPYPPEKEGR